MTVCMFVKNVRLYVTPISQIRKEVGDYNLLANLKDELNGLG